MRVIGIIPARYASSRFPGKPLVEINGKTMIQRVYEQVSKASSIQEVIVATDDERIYKHVVAFGKVVMTAEDHQSGTDRCAEVLSKVTGFDIVVNIQGDEPFINPLQIDNVVSLLAENEDFDVATLAKKIDDEVTLFNPNAVKVVFDKKGKALYFSRSPIPHCRGKEQADWLARASFFKHIGMYAFRANKLLTLADLKQSTLELTESLEQLRWLENGYSIGVGLTEFETLGIDTPEDLELIK